MRAASAPRSARRLLGAALCASLAACLLPAPAAGPRPGVPLVAVGHPAAAPFSSICRLEVHRRRVNGLIVTEHEAVSTATLLDTRHLLTAAHSFSSPPHMPVTGRAMECGARGSRAAWSRTDLFRRGQLKVVPEFEGEVADDYAVMSVGATVPVGAAFRLPRPGEPALRPGDTVHVAGYALDHGEYDGRRLYHGTGRVRATSRDSTSFVYDVETRGGMSGSPVWVVRRRPDGEAEYVIVGVHLGRHYIGRRLWALARRIRGDALSNVHGWLAADSARAR